MQKLGYIDNLTMHERASAIKLGCAMSMGRNGVSTGGLRKSASGLGGWQMLPKSIIVTSLLAGIPLGALAHGLGRSVSKDNRAEREAMDRLKYFQQLTAGMGTKIKPPPATAPAEADETEEGS